MNEYGIKNPNASIADLGLGNVGSAYWNLTTPELVEETILQGMGELTDTGALAIDTGEFTGRSPKDKFTVLDAETEKTVWWGDINIKFDAAKFDHMFTRLQAYLTGREVYVRDAYACADQRYRLNVRVVTEYPWQNLFVNNLFLRPTREEIETINPDWVIINAPGFMAVPAVDGTRQHNFAMINFTKKMILIGGTGYTGEIKKGIFTVLNYVLPQHKGVLSMHCSANIGKDGDTALFFGLSGTGKTTLSADPNRGLIGDDEHGWSDKGVFNFEGGCYAKCIDLTEEKEPDIYRAIKPEAILENIVFHEGTNIPDFSKAHITENTRVSYPLGHIRNSLIPSIGGHPKNIFFLTCDAYGILPPISRLTKAQAMYHFISGYTAKVAGTEAGVTEPKATFSACFGAPFLPLHPTFYAEMVGEKIEKFNPHIWLINTGWTGGPYGVGSRMKLSYTRAMITAALKGELDHGSYDTHEIFGLHFPAHCPGVPSDVLNPRNTWADPAEYDRKAADLARMFVENFSKYSSKASEEILNAAPRV